MELIKFDRIVSVNSEIPGHNAKNIVEGGEIRPNKNWMCEKGTEKGSVILQMERAALITSVHIGNANSAFVEVLVGKAADSSDQFESLIPMSVFMSPQESKTGTNPNRTRFFHADDFNEETAKKTWDRIKVVCSQPFNKLVPYGLCFVKVHGEKEKGKEEEKKDSDKDEIQIGSFFKKARKSSGDEKPTLSVSEQMKKEEREIVTTPNVKRKASPMPETSRDQKKMKMKMKKKKKRKKRKPFERLMEDVVFVISGFQNPLRSEIRSKALEMGARYSADWAPHCTHLVCAYPNTPKFQQVKGKGKIVKKEWVEVCHKDRRRYPWRRYALDKEDAKKKESEEEIEGEEETESEEEEEEEEEPVRTPMPEKVTKETKSDEYDAPTDDEDPRKLVDTTDYPMPFLPDFLTGKKFHVDPRLRDRASLERYLVAYNGSLTDPRKDLDFYVTERSEGATAEEIKKIAPNALMVKPSWIWEMNTKQGFVSPK